MDLGRQWSHVPAELQDHKQIMTHTTDAPLTATPRPLSILLWLQSCSRHSHIEKFNDNLIRNGVENVSITTKINPMNKVL